MGIKNQQTQSIKMKTLSVVCVLLQAVISQANALPAPATILQDGSNQSKESPLNPLLQDVVPPLLRNATVVYPEREIQESEKACTKSFIYGDVNNLKWVSWPGYVPSGAVTFYNGYVGRTDYICRYGCSSGFYTHGKGSYCYYPLSGKEYRSTYFDILVNVDNFEILEWQYDTWGSVPSNSISVCSSVFVGKNKYGLGKVVPDHGSFFLPYEGDEYWYKYYDVYTVNRGQYSQRITNVQYNVDQMSKEPQPPYTMKSTTVNNYNCEAVTKVVQMEMTTERTSTFETGRSSSLVISTSITAGIPLISMTVDFTVENTFYLTQSSSMSESVSHSLSVEDINVPPNHSCTVRMEGRKYSASIPFTARLSRTLNGETRSTAITGTYRGTQVSEVIAVVDRCQPLPDAQPCP